MPDKPAAFVDTNIWLYAFLDTGDVEKSSLQNPPCKHLSVPVFISLRDDQKTVSRTNHRL
jgi:predicted nucleic acid-binding protein